MQWRSIVTTAVLTIALVCGPAHGAQYYISPDGNDEAAGTLEAPWQSITRANEALEAGDTAVFLPGEYAGQINPVNSGTADAPITYRSEQPRAARLLPGDAPEIIRLDGHEHIAIEDFYVDGESRVNWMQFTGAGHVTVRGCTMRRARAISLFLDCSQLRLVDNLFSADRTRGDMLHVRDCHEILFEGNSTTRSGHCPLRIQRTTNVTVRANVFRCEWGRNYEFWKNGRMLIEGNIFTRARDSAGSGGACSKNLFDYSIFRHNLIFDNHYLPMCSGSYVPPSAGPESPLYRGPFQAVNSRYYHNTFSENLGPAYMFTGINVSGNVFQNNIFHRSDWTGGHLHFDRRDHINRSNRLLRNLFWSDEAGRATIRYVTDRWTIEEANENTRAFSDFWSEFHENIDADPAFVDAANRNYRLSAGSAAIDAGSALTWAVGEGTDSILPVNDGIVFYDGFGIEGEEGDWIAVGSGDNLAQIQRIELRHYLPALLHLDREVTWTNAMPVSLPWAGEAPDMGAYEHGLEHPERVTAVAAPATVEPGEPVHFSLDTLGKQLDSVIWDFEDGTFSHEPEPPHTFAEAGHYGVTVRATFANGSRSLDALFITVAEPADPSAPLIEADFEDETRLTHWDFKFKFYRPHQTGSARVEREDGDGMCMHIFYDENKDNRTAGQVAPWLWDIDRHPILRFEYRIPQGVPVLVNLASYPAPGRPSGFVLATTEGHAGRTAGIDGYTLVDDGQWHEITIDVRRAREIYPELQHLRQFMFTTPWTEAPRPANWDDFSALAADVKGHPDGPDDMVLHSHLDIVMLRSTEPGHWLEMPFTLEEEATGEVFVNLLGHSGRGAVRILLNGEVVVEDFEHYSAETTPQRVSLGAMTLPAGEHTLRLEVLERRVGYIGLTGISIRPEGAEDVALLAVEDFEFWFDNFAILPED